MDNDPECDTLNISENSVYNENNSDSQPKASHRHTKPSQKEEKARLFRTYVKAVKESTKIQGGILEVMKQDHELKIKKLDMKEKIYKLKEKNYRLREKNYYLKKKATESKEKQAIETTRLKKQVLEAKIEANRIK